MNTPHEEIARFYGKANDSFGVQFKRVELRCGRVLFIFCESEGRVDARKWQEFCEREAPIGIQAIAVGSRTTLAEAIAWSVLY